MRSAITALTLACCVSAGSMAHAQTTSGTSNRAPVIWTIGGAAGGFGIGLWAGLTAFDDSINSDRKVWTSAIVGAAVGAVGGYLIGRALRPDRSRPSRSHLSRPRRKLSGPPGSDPWAGFSLAGQTRHPAWQHSDRDSRSSFADVPQCAVEP